MKSFPLKVYKVVDRSMEPALKAGDYILVNTWYTGLRYRDMVVLRHPRKGINIVKRISRIEEDMLYVCGDNPNQSEDSRHFGDVYKKDIIGKVIYRI